MKIIEEELSTTRINKISKKEVIEDFRIAFLSRQLSFMARKEVFTGKAKFGIFGDGKELAQIAYAKAFKNGDWRSGYYRDQTFLLATGMSTPIEFFAQIYGDTDLNNNPSNGGRSFNNHFATRILNDDGTLKNLVKQKNTAADLSPTAAQLPRLVGLAYASKLFRQNGALHNYKNLSINGNEVAFGMIGDGATAEGHFFETVNAAGVLQVPMALAVWDDGYGISVPGELQVIKGDIGKVLQGFEIDNKSNGIIVYKVKGWDYPSLVETFRKGISICREKHIPVVFHVEELTQPFGHSTSGSHERYKSVDRIEWEKEWDALKKFEEWIIENEICYPKELEELKREIKTEAKKAQKIAWDKYQEPIKAERSKLVSIIQSKKCKCAGNKDQKIIQLTNDLQQKTLVLRSDNYLTAKRIIRTICSTCSSEGELKGKLDKWLSDNKKINYERYNKLNYCESELSSLDVQHVKPVYDDKAELINGREVLRDNFKILFEKYPLLVTFGEDTGKLGDVNKGLEGLQDIFGDLRITDTGIRETTIIGQGIGLALRGMRPIAEIQYLDYLIYALQTLTDDLACLHYRTAGGQSAPLIVRTRGHRLEGIWHSGSPMAMLINSLRGMYICVPRNMTQASGFYNTLVETNDPTLVIEPLNGYNLKERKPRNLGAFKIPLGIPDILEQGSDVTLVTYGSCVKIAQEAIAQLKEYNISVELIDVQTLIPFDRHHVILESIKKTNKVLFFDEDVPGGTTAYMMQQVLEHQGAWKYLDSKPRTLSAHEHRPAYSTDGDYFSNPNAEDVFDTIYSMMHEYNPDAYS